VLVALPEGNREGEARIGAFRDELQKLGWTAGRNIRLDYRWAGPDPERLRIYAAELLGLAPDVILAAAQASLTALRAATRTVPIVFAQIADPVGDGFVNSLAQPGGNITGYAQHEQAIGVKWLELLSQIAPSVTRVAVIADLATPSSAGYLREIEAAVPSFGVQLAIFRIGSAEDIAHAINTHARDANAGMIVLPGPTMTTYRELIVALANEKRLPAVYPFRYFVTDGGLASYGLDVLELYRGSAFYVDRILKGEKPASLPVQLPTKFELVINLKTAKALGLDPPLMLLARTDEVIE
jgi:putative ABC transport system substrate-binding protein